MKLKAIDQLVPETSPMSLTRSVFLLNMSRYFFLLFILRCRSSSSAGGRSVMSPPRSPSSRILVLLVMGLITTTGVARSDPPDPRAPAGNENLPAWCCWDTSNGVIENGVSQEPHFGGCESLNLCGHKCLPALRHIYSPDGEANGKLGPPCLLFGTMGRVKEPP